jgi:hypothetical protein
MTHNVDGSHPDASQYYNVETENVWMYMTPQYEQLARDIEKYTSDFNCFQSTFRALNRIYFDIIKREENLKNRSLASLLDELLTRITTEFQTLSSPTEFVQRDNLDYSVKGVNLRFRWMQYILQQTQARLQVLLVQAQELLQKWWIDMAIIDPEKTVYEISQSRKSTTQQECWDIFCECIKNLPVQENEKREEARPKNKSNRKDNTSPKRGYSPEKKRQGTRTISEKYKQLEERHKRDKEILRDGMRKIDKHIAKIHQHTHETFNVSELLLELKTLIK